MRLYVAGSDVDVEVQEWQQHAADQDNDEIHLDDFAESIEDMAAAMELREDAQDPKWQRVFVAVDPEECAVYVFNELGQPVTSARGEISEGRQDLDDVSIGFLSWWKRGLYRLPVTESGAAAAPSPASLHAVLLARPHGRAASLDRRQPTPHMGT